MLGIFITPSIKLFPLDGFCHVEQLDIVNGEHCRLPGSHLEGELFSVPVVEDVEEANTRYEEDNQRSDPPKSGHQSPGQNSKGSFETEKYFF